MTMRLLSRTPEGQQRRIWIIVTALGWGTLLALAYTKLTVAYNSAADFAYDYVTARGFLDGLDISSISVGDLGTRYLSTASTLARFYYANVHPPALVLVDVPFALLPFPIASAVWMLTNIGLLLVVGRWLGLSRPASLALVAWPPLYHVLDWGQYELMMLFLVMAGWRAAKSGQDYRAGALIGLAAVVKFYPGLFVIPFLVQRRFRLVLSTCLVFLLGQVAGAWMLGGPLGLLGYYQRLTGVERDVLLPWADNSSVYAALDRLLGDAGGVSTLIHAPGLILPITLVFTLFGLLALIRLRPEAAPVAALVALPNGEPYYAVFALPQLFSLWRHRGGWRLGLVAIGVAISLPRLLTQLVVIPTLLSLGLGGQASVTVVAALLTVTPMGYVALLALSSVYESPASQVGNTANGSPDDDRVNRGVAASKTGWPSRLGG